MLAIAIESVTNSIIKFDSELQDHISKATLQLSALIDVETAKFSAMELQYLNDLLANIDDIVLALPSSLQILSPTFPELDTRNNTRHAWFSAAVLDALDYEGMRSVFFPMYFQDIGIKACVYCNSQLTVSIDSLVQLKTKVRKDIKAKFQVDHYWPKSKYPCFSISLFNLYPSCASCNNSKSNNAVNFTLYQNKIDLKPSGFSFKLVEASRLKYLYGGGTAEDLEFTFTEPTAAGFETFETTFDVKGIYNTQKDVIAELLEKAKMYSPAYKKQLIKLFPNLFSDANLANRLIVGNYVDGTEVHKRPMSKFMQEIAEQIGLIHKAE